MGYLVSPIQTSEMINTIKIFWLNCLLKSRKYYGMRYGWLVGFVALRPNSTAMVIAGRSVHLTTLFPGQA